MKQKKIFLDGEGDAWFERNRKFLNQSYNPEDDPVSQTVLRLIEEDQLPKQSKVMEIGCGDGSMLNWLQKSTPLECHGIDPSKKAVNIAKKRGVNALVGTADDLKFSDDEFDLVIFGFCLYLCDRDDLFQITSEANRVLKPDGWIIIKDFYSRKHYSNDYHHRSDIKSYKMDYSKIFTWHPEYTLYSQDILDHSNQKLTDSQENWIAISLIRKKGLTF